MADNSQPLDHTPGPMGDRGDISLTEAVRALERLVDLATLEVDLMKANNALLTLGGRGTGPGARSPHPPGASGPKSGSEEGQGLGHALGSLFGDRVRESRAGRYGSAARKVASGTATELGASPGVAGKIGGAAGVVGAAVGAVISLVEGLVKARNAINDWTESAFESAARLAEVSGSMAAVMGQREINQVRRDVERGEATAGSAGRLQEAESRRKDEENKLGATIDNATNNVLAEMNKLLTPVIELLNAGVEGLKELPWGVGAAIKKLTEGDPVGPGTLAKIGEAARAEMAAVDARGRGLMDAARIAAGRAVAGRAPGGAAPLGRVP